MENSFYSIPGPAWVGLATIAIVAILYLTSRVRASDMDILRSANKDLRSSIDDGDKKITGLEHAVNTLEHKVEDLEKKNKSFEELIITALKQYFFENPSVASDIKKIVTVG